MTVGFGWEFKSLTQDNRNQSQRSCFRSVKCLEPLKGDPHMSLLSPDQRHKQHFAPVPKLNSRSSVNSKESPSRIITGSWFQGQNSPNVVAGGGEKRGIFLCLKAFSLWHCSERDYITSIVASEPSAFIHWSTYGGPSDPHKERAFQQFSKQEVWTQCSHLITVKLIDPVSHRQKETHGKKHRQAY